jgi:hypothetical protein
LPRLARILVPGGGQRKAISIGSPAWNVQWFFGGCMTVPAQASWAGSALGLRLSLCGYRRGEWEARHNVGPSPPYTTGFGARVARQRCPVLRAGTISQSTVTPQGKLPAGAHKAINATLSNQAKLTRVPNREVSRLGTRAALAPMGRRNGHGRYRREESTAGRCWGSGRRSGAISGPTTPSGALSRRGCPRSRG